MKYAAIIAVTLLMAGCTALPLSRGSGVGESASGIICSPRWNEDANQQTWNCGDDAMTNISPLVYAEVTDAY
jgi:hypothetical protein